MELYSHCREKADESCNHEGIIFPPLFHHKASYIDAQADCNPGEGEE